MSVVSATDYLLERRLEQLGPLAGAALNALTRRALDQEFADRRRIVEGRTRVADGPTPAWVRRIRDGDSATRKTSPSKSFDVAHDVDFRPDREAHFGHFELLLGSWARESIRSELAAAAPLKVETGGFLLAPQRRPFFADVCVATGPAPNSKHGRTSVMVGEVGDVRAELGISLDERPDLKHIGCWHSHPSGSGEPSRADLNVWRRRLEASGWEPVSRRDCDPRPGRPRVDGLPPARVADQAGSAQSRPLHVRGRTNPRTLGGRTMRRPTPKRASDPWPADQPLRPSVPALRVTKDFVCEGLRFREGQLLSPDSPIAQAIHREYPEYLKLAS